MKKYVHIFEDKIVSKYESEKSLSFGGEWAKGESKEVPEEWDLDLVAIQKGELVLREKSQEELAVEAKETEKKDFKELLKNLSKSDMDTVAEIKEVLHKLIKALI